MYLGDIPTDVRERDVEDFFKDFGKIRDITMKTGYAFVEFDDDRDADDAVYELDNKRWEDGKRVRVEMAKDDWKGGKGGYSGRGGRGFGRSGQRRGPPERSDYRLLVHNVPRNTSWQDLKDVFRDVGEVKFTDVHKPREGDGLVEFATSKGLEKALKYKDEWKIRGRWLDVYREKRRSRDRRTRSKSRTKSRSKDTRSRSNSRSRSKSVSKHAKSGSKDRSRSRSSKSRSRSRSGSKERSYRASNKESRAAKRERSRSRSGSKRSPPTRHDSRKRSISRSNSRDRSRSRSVSRHRTSKRTDERREKRKRREEIDTDGSKEQTELDSTTKKPVSESNDESVSETLSIPTNTSRSSPKGQTSPGSKSPDQ